MVASYKDTGDKYACECIFFFMYYIKQPFTVASDGKGPMPSPFITGQYWHVLAVFTSMNTHCLLQFVHPDNECEKKMNLTCQAFSIAFICMLFRFWSKLPKGHGRLKVAWQRPSSPKVSSSSPWAVLLPAITVHNCILLWLVQVGGKHFRELVSIWHSLWRQVAIKSLIRISGKSWSRNLTVQSVNHYVNFYVNI